MTPRHRLVRRGATDITPSFTSGFATAATTTPPYSEDDAKQYFPGATEYPNPHKLMANMLAGLEPGQRAGLIHYVLPRCPKDARFVACVGVVSGFANRVRLFSVFEK